MLKRRYSRADLQRFKDTNQLTKLVNRGCLSINPEAAVERVIAINACEPSTTGDNIKAIRDLRKAVAKSVLVSSDAQAFAIVAPHTHWPLSEVIVEEFIETEDCYLIGPLQIPEMAVPISFVITKDGLEPYEFAGDSVFFSDTELDRIKEILMNLFAVVVDDYPHLLTEKSGLGVSINHRFKRVFDAPLCPTMEYPTDISPFPSRVERDVYSDKSRASNFGQVGWSISDPPKQITDREEQIANELVDLATKNDPADFLELLEVLKSKKT